MFNKKYEPPKSDTEQRTDRETSHKRLVQDLMFQCIKKITKEEKPEGDWYHTAGPGKVKINYVLYSNIVNPKNTYNIIEYFEDSYRIMQKEFDSLEKFLKNEKEINKPRVRLRNDELMNFVKKEIQEKKQKVLVVDADFCASAKKIITNKDFQTSFIELAELQRKANKEWFFALTYCLRNPQENKISYINLFDHMCRFENGKCVFTKNYRDGAPMRTVMWHFQY